MNSSTFKNTADGERGLPQLTPRPSLPLPLPEFDRTKTIRAIMLHYARLRLAEETARQSLERLHDLLHNVPAIYIDSVLRAACISPDDYHRLFININQEVI